MVRRRIDILSPSRRPGSRGSLMGSLPRHRTVKRCGGGPAARRRSLPSLRRGCRRAFRTSGVGVRRSTFASTLLVVLRDGPPLLRSPRLFRFDSESSCLCEALAVSSAMMTRRVCSAPVSCASSGRAVANGLYSRPICRRRSEALPLRRTARERRTGAVVQAKVLDRSSAPMTKCWYDRLTTKALTQDLRRTVDSAASQRPRGRWRWEWLKGWIAARGSRTV